MQDFVGASSIALALLALLAVGVFVPAWVREHNERQAQRHAIRLQQTIRALAHTTQLPEVVEVEATAREVRTQQRELRRARKLELGAARERARAAAKLRELAAKRMRAEARARAKEREAQEAEMADAVARREAAARARAAAARAALREAQVRSHGESAAQRWSSGSSGSSRAAERKLAGKPAVHRESAPAARRRKRGRLAATAMGLLGGVLLLLGAVAGAGLTLMLLGLVIIAAAAWMLVCINRVWLAQRATETTVVEPAVQHRQAESKVGAAEADSVTLEAEPQREDPEQVENGWTPVPLPKPLYLGRSAANSPKRTPGGSESGHRDQRDEDRTALLRAAAERSAQVIRDSHREVPTLPSKAHRIPPITASDDRTENAWAKVGNVEEILNAPEAGECADLDAVLRRRRAS